MAAIAPSSSVSEDPDENLDKKNAPVQEFLLQGSVLDSAVEVLLHRLRGLCDNCDTGPETFHDHEMCYTIRPPTGPFSLRVRRALDLLDAPYQLRYIGQAELGPQGDKTRPTIVRNSIEVATSSNVIEFLNELGFRMDFEYIARGYMFRKGRIKITVSKISKTKTAEGYDNFSQSYLVEMSVIAPTKGQDGIGEDMRNFAEQLKPLIQLEKFDYKRLGPMP